MSAGNATANISLKVKSEVTSLDELLGKIRTIKTELEALNSLVPKDLLTQQFQAQVKGAADVGTALNRLQGQVKNVSAEQAQSLKNLAADVQSAADKSVKTAGEAGRKIVASYREALGKGVSISYRMDPQAAKDFALSMSPPRDMFDKLNAQAKTFTDNLQRNYAASFGPTRGMLDSWVKEGQKAGAAFGPSREMWTAATGQINKDMAKVAQMTAASFGPTRETLREGTRFLMEGQKAGAAFGPSAEVFYKAVGRANLEAQRTAQMVAASYGPTRDTLKDGTKFLMEGQKAGAAFGPSAETFYRAIGRANLEAERSAKTLASSFGPTREMWTTAMGKVNKDAEQAAQRVAASFGPTRDTLREGLRFMQEGQKVGAAFGPSGEMFYRAIGKANIEADQVAKKMAASFGPDRNTFNASQMSERLRLSQQMVRAEVDLNEQRKIGAANARFQTVSDQSRLNIARQAAAYGKQEGITPRLVELKFGSDAASFANPRGLVALNMKLEESKQKVKELTDAYRQAQIVLDANFITASPSARLNTATKAAIVQQRGGDAVGKFGQEAVANSTPEALARLKSESAAYRAEQVAMASGQTRVNTLLEEKKAKALEAAAATKAHAAAMREAHSAARGLAAGFGQLWATYGSIVPMVAGFGIAKGLQEAVEGFVQVQYQMTFVKALGDDTTISVSKLSHELHDVSKALGIAPEAAAKGMRVLAQAGLTATQSLSALPEVFKLATVGEIEMGAAANAVIGVLNAFDLSKSSISYVGDIMAKAGAMSATSVSAMTESMKVASPVAAQFKFSLEETAMALTALAKINITGSAAGTSVKNMMAELAAPTSKKSRGIMEMLGFSSFDGKTGEMKPLIDQVEQLREGLQRYDRQSQGRILTALFGAKGEKAFFALLKQAKEDSQKMLDDLSNSNGFNAGVFSQLQQTTKGQFDLLKSSIANTFSGIGEVADAPLANFLRTLRGFLELGPVISAIKGFGQSMVTLGSAAVTYGAPVLAFLGSWKLATLAVGGTLSILSAAAAGISAIGVAALSASGGVAALSAIMNILAKNPLMLVITAITTLVGLYALLREKKQTVLEQAANEITAIEDATAALDKENAAREKKLILMAQGKSAAEAEALAKVQEADDATAGIQKELAALRNSQAYKDQVAAQKKKPLTERGMELAYATGTALQNRDLLDQEQRLVAESQKLQDRANNFRSSTRTRMEQLKREKAAADAETERMKAELAELLKTGPKTYNPDADDGTKGAKAALRDGYNASQKELDGQLEASRDKARYNIEKAISENRRSQLGDLQLINLKLAENTKMREDDLRTFIQKEQLAAKTENRKTDVASIGNKKDAIGRAQNLDEMQAEEARADYVNKVNDAIVKKEAETARDRGQLYKAFMLEWEAANRDTLAKVYADLNDPKVEAKLKAAAERMLGFMNQEYQSGSTNALFSEKKAEYDKLKAQMDEQLAAANEKGSAKGGMSGALIGISLAQDIREEALPALKQLQQELAKLSVGNPNLEKVVANIGKDMAKDANRAEDAWRNAAKSIEKSLGDAFGKGGKALGGMIRATVEYGDKQKDINDKLQKDKQGKSPAEQIALEDKARKESLQGQMGYYADVASAAKNNFDSRSKEYKILEGAERGFRAVEMALAAEAFIRKNFFATGTAAVQVGAIGVGTAANVASVAPNVAADQAKAGSAGLVAVAKAIASLPFPMNLVAGGITLAAIVGLGVKMSGGLGNSSVPRDQAKDRQDRAGTSLQGKAYEKGDEDFEFELVKSDAIATALDVLKENSNLALRHSNGMLLNLQSIKDNIGGMASFISQASGMRGTRMDTRELGIGETRSTLGFSRTKTTLEDTGLLVAAGQTIGTVISQGLQASIFQDVKKESSSFWGLSKSTKNTTITKDADQDLLEKFQSIIQNMSETVVDAASFLGGSAADLQARVASMGVDLGKISFKGMKADEIQAELEAIFGKMGDDMAKEVMPGIRQFNKAGEDYLTTLVRVSSGVEQAQVALAQFGLTAIDVSAVINKQGDISAEIVKQTIAQRESTWSRVSRWGDAFGGGEMVASLTEVGKIINELPGNASELVNAYKDLVQIRSQMSAIGLNSAGLTMETIKGAGGLDELSSGVSNYLDSFFTAAGQNAAKASQLEEVMKGMQLSMPRTKEDFVKLVNSIDMTNVAGQRLYGQLMAISGEFANVADAVGYVVPELIKLRGTITSESAVKEPTTLVEDAERWLDIRNNARELRDELSEAIYEQRKDLYERNADLELTGDALKAQEALKTELATLREAQEKSSAERIAKLWEDIRSAGISPEQQLELASELKDEILNRYEIEKENTEKLLDFAKEMREYVKDLRTSDLSPMTMGQKMSEAEAQFNATLAKANSGDTNAMDALQGKADTYLTLARDFYASSDAYRAIFAMITGQLENAATVAEGQAKPATAEEQQVTELQKLRDFMATTTATANGKYDQIATTLASSLAALQKMEALYGIQSTVPDILKALPAEIAAHMVAAGLGGEAARVAAATATANAYVPAQGATTPTPFYNLNFGGGSGAINGSHAKGLDYVPFDGYIAELHKGERVVTAAENVDYGRGDAASVALVAEIRALRQEVAQLRQEQNAQTAAMMQAQYDAADRSSDKVVDGVCNAADNAAWKDRSAATLK